MNREILNKYRALGFCLFPVNKQTKTPAIKGWQESATSGQKQIESWSEKFPGCNWGVFLKKSSHVVVDVDTRNGGFEKWEELCKKNGAPNTLTQKTGSGGLHFVFRAKEGVRYKGLITDGIDIKHNGFIVVEPSTNKNASPYKWITNLDKGLISEPPVWIQKLIGKKPCNKTTSNQKQNNEIVTKVLNKLIYELKEKPLSYDEWFRCAASIHDALPTEEGFKIALDLTMGTNYEPGDDEKLRDMWKSFNAGRLKC